MGLQKNILFVHYGENWIRGSEQCLINLIRHMDKCQFKPIVWTNNKDLAKALEEMKVVVEYQDFTLLLGWVKPRLNIPNFFRLIGKSLKMIRENDIDLIHVNSGAPVQWTVFASKISGTPIVNHLHSSYQFRDRMSLFLHNCSHTVCVSKAVQNCMLRDLPKRKDRTSVIYNGINRIQSTSENNLDLRKMLSIDDRSIVVATVGSLIKRKGMDRCIRVLSKLLLDNAMYHLVVIGSGSEEEALKNLASNLGVSKHVHFIGNMVKPFDLLKAQADVYLSLPRDEAFGLTCVESAYASLPVVAQAVGGIKEVLTHEKSGLLVSTVEEAVSAVSCLVNNPCVSEKLVAENIMNARKRFSMRRYCESFERLYGMLIRKNELPKFSIVDFSEIMIRYVVGRIKSILFYVPERTVR